MVMDVNIKQYHSPPRDAVYHHVKMKLTAEKQDWEKPHHRIFGLTPTGIISADCPAGPVRYSPVRSVKMNQYVKTPKL